MSSEPTPSSFRAASQESHPTSFWQLTPFFLYVLWQTIKPVAVALSPAVNCWNNWSIETECTSYLLCENVFCETFLGTQCVPSYHLCMYTMFSFMPSDCMWSPKVGSLYLSHAVSLQSAAAQLGCFPATWVWRMITVCTTMQLGMIFVRESEDCFNKEKMQTLQHSKGF